MEHLKESVLVLRSLNHNLRMSMVNLVSEHGSMTVTDIYIKLRLEQSVASQHLAILRRQGILITERKGKHILYSVDKRRLRIVKDAMRMIHLNMVLDSDHIPEEPKGRNEITRFSDRLEYTKQA